MLAASLAASGATLLAAGEIPGASIVLETPPLTPGSDPAGAPPRFVLLKDGQVFVGGTERVEVGRLEKDEAQALRKRADSLRKLPGIDHPLEFGGAPERVFRLALLEHEPLEITATGDPAQASAALAPLAALVRDLEGFLHPSLRPYAATSYALRAREARLVGGCRAWGFALPLAEVLAGARSVSAAEASSWPTGALPASVCSGEKRYAVTLRPLLPGEQP
jgi:hypothetical protein